MVKIIDSLEFGVEVRECKKCSRVEVVHCMDCHCSRPLNRNHSYEDAFMEGCLWCTLRQDGVLPDDYCSDGQRRADNGE